MVLGAVGFVLGFAGGALMIPQACNDDGSCDTSIPVTTRLHWGAVVGAVVGAVAAGWAPRWARSRGTRRATRSRPPDPADYDAMTSFAPQTIGSR